MTKDVLDHHLKCFGASDLEGVLADYAPDAVLFTPAGLLKGHAAMKPAFLALFADFGQPGTKFTMLQQVVEGDYAHIVWTAETANTVYELGTDSFVVRDGKIVAHFFSSKTTRKR